MPRADDKTFIEKFESDVKVQAEIMKLKSSGLTETDGGHHLIQVGGQCGFVGCSYEVLVIRVFYSPGANTRTDSVAAILTQPATSDSPEEVKIIKFDEQQ